MVLKADYQIQPSNKYQQIFRSSLKSNFFVGNPVLQVGERHLIPVKISLTVPLKFRAVLIMLLFLKSFQTFTPTTF